MAEKRGLRGLEEWCRRVTEGYNDVHIKDMSHSWRDGLAFCAIIHHFAPDLIDYSSLSKENILHNNSLAFSVAEKQLGIPALLDAEDLVNCIEPDRLSIATYLSQLYQYFEGGGNKKFLDSSNFLKQRVHAQNYCNEPVTKSTKNEREISLGKKYETCQLCKHRVFILERLMVDGKLYHRTCFKCYRCQALLKPGAYNEGEIVGTYECTVCPQDEEAELSKSNLSENFTEIGSTTNIQVAESTKSNDKTQVRPLVSNTFTEARKNFLQNNLKQEAENKSENINFQDTEKILKANNLKSETNLTDSSCGIKKYDTSSQSEIEANLEINTLGQISNQASITILKKPPIAKKPAFSSISPNNQIRSKYQNFSNGNDGSNNHSATLENINSFNDQTTDISSSKYPCILNKNEETKFMKLKSLQRSISEINTETSDQNQIKNVTDLPVIKSSNYQVPFLNRSLSRTTSENNIQQTPKLSILSEALLFPARTKENEDLQNILHSKWSKQGNYQKLHNKSFTNLVDLKNGLVEKTNDQQLFDNSINLQSFSINIDKHENKILNEDTENNICNKDVKEETEIIKNDSLCENNHKNVSKKLHNEAIEQNLNDIKTQEINEISEVDTTKTTKETNDMKTEYPIDLNPFGSDDSDAEENITNENYPDDLNPFETSEDEETSSFTKSDTLPIDSFTNSIDNNEYDRNFNPFYSSSDDDGDEQKFSSNHISFDSKYNQNYSKIIELRNEIKKKKKAPPPPPPSQSLSNDENLRSEFQLDKKTSVKQSISLKPSPRLSQKKIAPKPPINLDNTQTTTEFKIDNVNDDKLENKKENTNISSVGILSNKPKQWRRKKRPAPSVPVPRKREIKMIPHEEIKAEMLEIEKKQQHLERQGRELEMLIREREDKELSMEEEKAILELFELVNLKNALFRRQAELMYIKRSQRLEEEQVEIEFQIRCLMNKPADQRSEEDVSKEEELLQRLLDVVEQRNEIVDTIEMDRKSRELQEDKSIKEHMEQKHTEIKEKWKGTLTRKKNKHKDKIKSKGKNKKQSSPKGEDQVNKDSKHKKNWF